MPISLKSISLGLLGPDLGVVGRESWILGTRPCALGPHPGHLGATSEVAEKPLLRHPITVMRKPNNRNDPLKVHVISVMSPTRRTQ